MRGLKWLVPVAAIAALAGCATTGSSSTATRTMSTSTFDADVDYQKMAIITEDALRRGYRIVWVHPPQKKKSQRN